MPPGSGRAKRTLVAAGKKRAGRGTLTRERILDAALAIVDEDGLDALSMRRLGDALGVEAMSLYRHVANKPALLDGVFEAVLRGMVVPPASGRWPDDVRAFALAFRDALIRHPRALPLFASRPAVSEASLEVVDAALGVLVRAGLPIDEALLVFQSVVALVVGHCLAHYGPAEGVRGVDYGALDRARFPHLRDIGPALEAYGPEDELTVGLELVIAGLAHRLGPGGPA